LWTEALGFLIMPVAASINGTLYMWLMVPLKWCLVGRITPKMMENGGSMLGGFSTSVAAKCIA
jgi:hypothetical protein